MEENNIKNEDLNNSIKSDESIEKNKNLLPKIEFQNENNHYIDERPKSNLFRKKIKSEEEKEEEQRIKNKVFRNANPCDVCIEALKKDTSERSDQIIKTISFYLQMLKNFMITFKDEIENEELDELLYNISSRLKYEHILKNKFICKYGEKADKFYIILRGKVTFCIPKANKHYLNEEEYILFLLKLRFINETELMKKNMIENKDMYDLGDNFDKFILKLLIRHEKQNETIYSNNTYDEFLKLKELIEKEKKNNIKKVKEVYEDILIEDYLQRCLFDINDDPHEAELKDRKLLDIYLYEKTNTFEDGDCFGFVGSNSKNHKRSATAISSDDCELATLFSHEYKEILDNISSISREKLYDLVISNKLFLNITKNTFINKCSHMFRFKRFFLNNIILNDNIKFNKIILFNSGEFILSVNKNLIELNELIIKIKKIRGKMLNLSEETIKKDLIEIKENEDFFISKTFFSNDINEFILKRQNLIISTINDNMVLGYPDTVDIETYMPLFNCKCISPIATGYMVEREMIDLFNREHFLRNTPPKVAILKIDFYLKRLLEYKKSFMNKIEVLKRPKKVINKNKKNILNNSSINNSINNIENIDNTNKNQNKSIDSTLNNKEYDQNQYIKQNSNRKYKEYNLNISRNNINNDDLKNNTFELKKEIISPRLEKTIQEQNNLSNLLTSSKNNLPSLNTSINYNQKKENDKYYMTISKLKENIIRKKNLLKAVQKQSYKFMLKENIENRKIEINKLINRKYYNDLTNIFSKNPDKKRSILDRYKDTKEDNILDPAINEINRRINYEKKLHSYLTNTNNLTNSTEFINNNEYNGTNDAYANNNIIYNYKNNNNNYYLKKKNIKFFHSNNTNFLKKKTIDNLLSDSKNKLKESFFFSPKDSKLKHIKLSFNNMSLDLDKNRNNNNNNNLNINSFKNIYNELYTHYIMSELNHKQINNNLNDENLMNISRNEKKFNSLSKYKKLDNFSLNKFKLLNTSKDNEIKSNYFTPKTFLHSQYFSKKGISIIDPLALDKFKQIYKKENDERYNNY